MARKATAPAAAPLHSGDLAHYSVSELVTLAQETGQFGAHRGMPKPALISMILAPKKVGELRSIDHRRLGIMEYVVANYEQVRPLLSCPAITRTPTACFSCSDVQVTHCWATNPDTFRTPSKKEAENIMAENSKYEPRTRAQWDAIANSSDMAERSLIAKALMDLGVKASDLRSLPTPADKVGKIMELQKERGFATEDAKAAPKAAKAAAGAKPAAAPAAGTKPAAAAAAPAGNGLGRLEERIDDVQTMLTAQGEEIAELKAMLVDLHAMVHTIFTMSGMDEAVFAELKGKLHDEGNG